MSALLQPSKLLEADAPPERRGIERDHVRMLVTDTASRSHTHARFFQLPSLLLAGDLLVVNDSATLPAAVVAVRANGETLKLHVSTQIDSRIWMVEPRGIVFSGEELQLPLGGSAVMLAPAEPEHVRVWYAWLRLPFATDAYLEKFGEPITYGYMRRRFPLSDYQTMFAREPGSSEMPSAARPFTPQVIAKLQDSGVELARITLHCGVASFEAPERPASERFRVPPAAAGAVNAARRAGRRVIAVGTTALRALETASYDGEVIASSGWTDLVIDEHHRLSAVDGLLTGFHDSAATHLWALRAFLDPHLLSSAYEEAAEQAYYCHEFGDVHLIL
jgi:S-adenosylmethionine:tRNA ribosyltransferase-isomerase